MGGCNVAHSCSMMSGTSSRRQEAGGRLASQVYLFMTQITRSNRAVLCRYRGRGAACVQNNQHLASRSPDHRASAQQAYLHNCLFIVFWQLIKCKAAGSNFPFLPVNVSITDQNSSSAQYFAKLKMSLVEQNSNKQVTSRLGLKVWEKEKHINLSPPPPRPPPPPCLGLFLTYARLQRCEPLNIISKHHQ